MFKKLTIEIKDNLPVEKFSDLVETTATEMYSLRFGQDNPLKTNNNYVSNTVSYLKLVNSLLWKADNSPHLKDEKEKRVMSNEIVLMKIFVLIVLDYSEMSLEDRKIVHEFAVHSPPLIE